MRSANWAIIAASLLFGCIACGAEDAKSAKPASSQAQKPASTANAESVSVGSVAFTVGGRAKNFAHVPERQSTYMRLASTIKAMPEPDALEALSINIVSIDLKKVDYPAELPPPKDFTQPVDPMLAMASVGFGYIDAQGNEWAGPGRIQLDSFSNDGLLQGSFSEVSLPHTEKTLPNIVLQDGRLQATISSPW